MENFEKNLTDQLLYFSPEKLDSINIVMASCSISAGANEVYSFFYEKLKKINKVNILKKSGCNGFCHKEPILEIFLLENELDKEKKYKLSFTNVDLNLSSLIFDYLFIKKKFEKEDIIKIQSRIDFLPIENQFRIVLRNSGNIDPENIEDYINKMGYEALKKVLKTMSPEEVILEIKKSGLRGRGGAGFPTGLKWEITYKNKNKTKYIICNGDEGDPGAFMDRAVLEGDPHSVLEGLIIGGYATEAKKGIFYIREEYPLALKRVSIAIEQAYKKGFLGNNILGSNFSFDVEIKRGAGAFVCGEETALIHSIEGKRGIPRKKPPFPSERGVYNKPTTINNVETFANIPWIILNGSSKFNSIGTEHSKGTKVFSLAGKINNSGLVEVPMGITLYDLIFKVGGGLPNNKKFKAIQIGGPSGGCLSEEHLNIKIDYEELIKTGAIMGSGGIIVLDEESCIVDVAKYFLNFTQNESCGKCTFCRIGTRRMLEILQKITDGEATLEDINKLEDLAYKIKNSSLCGLGQSAPNPIVTTLKYFRDEYIEHITDKTCRAKKCKKLLKYDIIESICTGCALCYKICPVKAITGDKINKYTIDPNKCIKCGLCYKACKFNAINLR
ncbi:MAG: 4Fe-4S binding protein [Spirochaetes bacterium]|nr:4Fe-4S binding protein [Spirochaetota bacterium]